jgi:DNA-binding MarR family transcriptional regulator
MATAMPKTPIVSVPKSDKEITDIYLQITRMIERLHRRHLDMLRFELDRLGIDGISTAQALMMTKIKGQTISVRDLVERGYYLGSNASYNIKQLVKSGFVIQERSPYDRRSMRLKLTEQGDELCQKIAAAEAAHAKSLAEEAGDMAEIAGTSHVLRNLENTWSNYLRYGDH